MGLGTPVCEVRMRMRISSVRSRVAHFIQPGLLSHTRNLDIAYYSKGLVPPTFPGLLKLRDTSL